MESTNPTPQSNSIASLLSGDPHSSLEDARHILQYLRTQVGTKCISDLELLRAQDVGWNTLFSADIYLWNQEKQSKRLTSKKNRWGYHNATRTKTSL